MRVVHTMEVAWSRQHMKIGVNVYYGCVENYDMVI